MPEPQVPFKTPITLTLEPGEYWWCRCGRSQDQPFCDDSHEQEGIFSPVIFTLDRTRTVKLYRCKHTGTPPYCDNSHLELE